MIINGDRFHRREAREVGIHVSTNCDNRSYRFQFIKQAPGTNITCVNYQLNASQGSSYGIAQETMRVRYNAHKTYRAKASH